MIHEFLEKIIGGHSNRYRMTILYAVIYLLISLAGKMDSMAFATFSGVFSVWIIGDSMRKS